MFFVPTEDAFLFRHFKATSRMIQSCHLYSSATLTKAACILTSWQQSQELFPSLCLAPRQHSLRKAACFVEWVLGFCFCVQHSFSSVAELDHLLCLSKLRPSQHCTSTLRRSGSVKQTKTLPLQDFSTIQVSATKRETGFLETNNRLWSDGV